MKLCSIYLFYLFLCSHLLFSLVSASESEVSIKPFWLEDTYSGTANGKIGFIGQSNKWTSHNTSSQIQSIEEACKEASRRVAEYFSVRVQSSVKSQLQVVGEQFQGRFEQSSKINSDVTLQGITRSETYIDKTQEGILISYCLMEMTSEQIAQTKLRLQKEQQAVDLLISQTIEQILNDDFERAKLSIAQLKNDDVNTTLIADLSELLEEQEKKALRVDLTLTRAHFATGDYLSFVIASNQNAYVYVFLEGEKSTKLLFPSPKSNSNLLIIGEPLQYPLKLQVQEGEAFRFPKSQTSQYQLRVVAAPEQQNIDFLHTSFNGYSVSNAYNYQQYIANCRLLSTCKVTEHNVLVEKGKAPFVVAHYNVKVNGQPSSKHKRLLKSALQKNKAAFATSGKNLIVEVQVDSAYSERLKAKMYIVAGKLYEIDANGEEHLLSRSKVSGLYDPKKLTSLTERLYLKLLKKAL